jgi:hypothetical protein
VPNIRKPARYHILSLRSLGTGYPHEYRDRVLFIIARPLRTSERVKPCIGFARRQVGVEGGKLSHKRNWELEGIVVRNTAADWRCRHGTEVRVNLRVKAGMDYFACFFRQCVTCRRYKLPHSLANSPPHASDAQRDRSTPARPREQSRFMLVLVTLARVHEVLTALV